jgi:hypothetical protein
MKSKQNFKRLGTVLFILILALGIFAVANVGAATADCSTSTTVTGKITLGSLSAHGKVDNCSGADANVGMISYKMYSDGSTQVLGSTTAVVVPGASTTLKVPFAECQTKVILYAGTEWPSKNSVLLERVIVNQAGKNGGYYCDQLPTPTPNPTKTPVPPTETPVTPTETPIPPTETPVPPTETPAPPTVTPPPAGGQGCTPGYWRQDQHFDSWMAYAPGDSYDATFGVDGSFATLLDAVWARGGGESALARHAVAALLNAQNADVSYLYSTADVLSMVQQAYATGDFNGVKNLFEAQNEAGCPLN